MSSAIHPEKLLRELDELWVELGRVEGEAALSGVLRACSMTLLVVTGGTAERQQLGETLAALMREHPSRAILLMVDEEARDLSAKAYVQCWMPFGKRQQICCEQLEILTSADRFADVVPVAAALHAPDLPVSLYARDARVLALPGFEALMAAADKMILDCRDRHRASPAAAQVIALKQRCPVLADLAWTLVTRWREAVSAAFDGPSLSGRAGAIRNVSFTYTGDHYPLGLLYLAAWFQTTLAQPLQMSASCREGGAQSQLEGVDISGNGVDLSLRRVEETILETSIAGQRRRWLFPAPSEFELLREELSLLGPDKVYDEVVQALPAVEKQLGRMRP